MHEETIAQLGELGFARNEALAYLTDQVVEDPSRNSPEALGALLDEWASRHEA